MPAGARIAVLEGDPTNDGPFVFRIKALDGYRLPPHTHPRTERVTVISSAFNVGMDDKFDATRTQAMPTGTYGYWESGMKHFVRIKGETAAQFRGMEPWKIEYVNPADDPRNKAEEKVGPAPTHRCVTPVVKSIRLFGNGRRSSENDLLRVAIPSLHGLGALGR